MKQITILILVFLQTTSPLSGQTESDINKTDQEGKKQGHWIRYYPGKTVMYDGYFRDNNPEGEFKRYNRDGSLRSVQIFSNNGTTAETRIFHPNGNIAATGKYVNRKKEGPWQFYSEFTSGYKVSEEFYTEDLRNGKSVKLFPEGNIAEVMYFVNDTAQGEWIKYYPDGNICLRSSYLNGTINGKFEAWFENGKLQFSGNYKEDKKDGTWLIYDKEGLLKYKIEYRMGYTDDRQMDIDSSDYLDALEKNKGSIPDPEKTGEIW